METFLFVAWNLVVFFLYGADKLFAKLQIRRIPEKVLLSMAFCFGGIGAFCGMQIFRHKTQKPLFRILVPSAVVINLALLSIFSRFLVGN